MSRISSMTVNEECIRNVPFFAFWSSYFVFQQKVMPKKETQFIDGFCTCKEKNANSLFKSWEMSWLFEFLRDRLFLGGSLRNEPPCIPTDTRWFRLGVVLLIPLRLCTVICAAILWWHHCCWCCVLSTVTVSRSTWATSVAVSPML